MVPVLTGIIALALLALASTTSDSVVRIFSIVGFLGASLIAITVAASG
jgi:hypothetical protein